MDLQQLFERFGVLIVFINALLQGLALPIPLTPVVLVAGAVTSDAGTFASLLLAVVAGGAVGKAAWFVAGRRYGSSILGFLCRFSLSPATCVARTTEGFDRWGAAFLVFGRFVPGVSLVTPPIAGALGMRWRKFFMLTALGAALWAAIIMLVGLALEPALAAMFDAVAQLPAGIWLAMGVLMFAYAAWRWRRRRSAYDRGLS